MRFKALLAIVATALALPLLPIVPAQANIAIGPNQCDRTSPSLCLNDYGGTATYGNAITVRPASSTHADAAMNVLQVDRSVCSGGWTVTNECPFTNDVLDSRWHGDIIVELNFNSVGNGNGCVVAGTLSSPWYGVPIYNTCGGNGTNWVQVPINHGAECYLVNVYMMNELSTTTAQVLDGSTQVGYPTSIDDWNGSSTQEWYNTAFMPCS